MNRNRKIWIAGFMLYLCTASMFAQIRGNEIRVVVSPDHSDWTYRLKEKCTFTIQVYKAQNVLPDVKVDYELGPEWYPTEKKDGVSLKDGKLTVSSSMNTPGFLRCKVKAYVGNKTYDGMATAAYAPESIRAHAVNPSDFDNFWEGTLKEARQVPLSSTMELLPSRCTETVNVYQVSFQNIRQGSRTFGILCMPKASGNYPALLRVPGAGVRPYYGDVETAAKGAITLEIGIHGIPVTMQQSVYDELAYGALYNYQYQNDDNRNYKFYRKTQYERNLQKGILVTSACAAFLLGNVQQAYAVAADAIEIVQQNKKIAGIVVDQNGEAVIGANVIQKGTTNGTITDIDGKFTLEVPAKAVLTVSFIGYQSQDVALKGNETQLTVTLKDDTEVLDEVVVVGYGTMKKRDLSGAVSQIKSDDLMKGNPTDLSQGLAGKVAGVQINAADGAPGGGVSIQVRGTNSFSTSSQPLFIVDGVPFDAGSTPASDANQNNNNTSNPLSFINPHDIQSIEVLKDASATAIYGSRGANGVVIITTKRGEAGYEQVEFSSNFSFSRIANKVKVLDAATYASYINEQDLNSYQYDGKPYAQLSYPGMWSYPSLPNGTLDYENGKYLPSPKDYRNPGYYTDEYGNQTWVGGADWQDLIYQNGFSQEYNLSVSGGSEKGWHAFSGNFLNQDGIIKESGFTRYALRANIGRKMYKWLEMGMNMNFTHTETDFSKTNSNDYGVIRSSLIFPPNYDPTHMDQTTNDELSWLASNPYAYINDTKDHLKAINVFTSSYAEVKLFPFLKFRQNLGISYTNHNRGTYFGQQTQEGSGQNGINGKAGQSDNWYMGITTESLFTFDKTFGVHGINAVVGFTAEKTNWGSKSMSATGFPNDLTQDYDMSLGTKPGKLQSDRGDAALASFLGRINYTLLDKYIFTASYRTDGSSKFTDANKWAGFLSGAFAWRMSEEKFIKDLNIFSNLKFRASYGETGNQGIGSYRTLPMLSVANYPFAGGINSGFAQVDWRGPVADDLRWETTAQYNVGLDMGFLNGRINLTVDYYHKKTRDLLQEVKIPLSTGFANMMVNSGYVTNEGLEISGKFYLLQNTPLKWNIDANISFNKNQIGGLEADQFATRLWYKADEVFLQRNGCPIGTIFGYVEDGFYDNLAEVMADPDPAVRAKGQKMIGEIKYRNFDDNPAITNADRVIIGDTNPDFVYGITNNFSWKNFTLSFFFQGSQGNDIFNGNLMDVKMGNVANIPQAAYDTRWTPETTAIAQWPKAVSSYERNMLISDRYVEDGSYLKLKNLNIGYNWANPFKGIKNLNFYASATNLFTITDYSWFDPEVNAFGSDASRRGVDIYSYPSSRTYSIGMKVTF